MVLTPMKMLSWRQLFSSLQGSGSSYLKTTSSITSDPADSLSLRIRSDLIIVNSFLSTEE